LQKIIFDSSFLMSVVETPTTWFEDIVDAIGRFQPLLPDCVKEELEKLAAGQGNRARTARVSLDLASKFSRIPCGEARVDDEIVSIALTNRAYVATTDAVLARSISAAHIRVISLRGGRVAIS
jgi:rRNA-processing protein FCF1